MKNALVYLLTAETYYCFYVHFLLKRLTGMWTFLESLTQFSGSGGNEELFQAQTHIFGHDKGMLSECHSAFSSPHSESLRHPKSPNILRMCPASDTQFSPLPLPCFLPPSSVDSVGHSRWVFYLVGCLSFFLHLLFTSLSSRACRSCPLQTSLSSPPKFTYLGLLGSLAQTSLILLSCLRCSTQYLDLERQSTLEGSRGTRTTGLWLALGWKLMFWVGLLWREQGLAPAGQHP